MRGGRMLGVLGAGLAVAVAAVSVCVGTTAGASPPTVAPGTLARGRILFERVGRNNFRCAFCHTLASAKATGEFAVDLDSEFAIDRKAGWSEARIRREVLGYLDNPPCFDPRNPNRCMPKRLYAGRDAATVAAFVAHCAGRSSLRGCEPISGGLSGQAARGEHLFATNGCPSCHWAANGAAPIGPTLNGLAGKRVRLKDGSTVVATDAYLYESILAPDAKIVAGFPSGFMSSRVRPGTLTSAQAKALVAYIRTLK